MPILPSHSASSIVTSQAAETGPATVWAISKKAAVLDQAVGIAGPTNVAAYSEVKGS